MGLQLKYDVAECEERGMTYSAPLKVTHAPDDLRKGLRRPATRSIRDIKEQEVFFGDIPLMTDNGTFIVNGTERVIVSQLHRSPGVFFETANNRTYFLGKIIPYRGSWVEFEYDQKNILYVRIDRKRKFLGTIFLRALGLRSDEEILRTFYTVDRIAVRDKKLLLDARAGHREADQPAGHEAGAQHQEQERRRDRPLRPQDHAAHAEGDSEGKDQRDRGRRGRPRRRMRRRRRGRHRPPAKCCSRPTPNSPPTSCRRSWTPASSKCRCSSPSATTWATSSAQTLRRDSVKTPQEALIEIYRKLRPGDPPTLDTATALFHGMFFDPRKYDFSRVGRLKFNIKLYEKQDATSLDNRTLEPEDFYATIRYLLKLRKNIGAVDDIDHLGNRRVRAVGELMENQFRIGLVRMERAIKEKMSVYQEMSTAMPHDLVNAKPVMAAIREFFGSSQLLAVHGPDQPAVGDHAQAPSLGPWAGRSVA